MSGGHGEAQSSDLGGIDRADLILLAIPLVFCAVYGVASLVAGGHELPVAGASLAAGGVVLDGLFLNPPDER